MENSGLSTRSAGEHALIIMSDNHIVLVDWLSIKSTCKSLHQVFCGKVAPYFIRQLRTDLHKSLGDFEGIFGGSYVLTGGYLLGQICGNVDPGSDIDFVITASALSDTNNIVDASEDIIHFKSTKLVIQGITVDQLTIEDVVFVDSFIATFDFDFCKNTFDGKTLKIIRPESVISRCTYVPIDRIRIIEQVDAIYGNATVPQKSFAVRLNERAQKYRNRGFTVEFAPEYFNVEK